MDKDTLSRCKGCSYWQKVEGKCLVYKRPPKYPRECKLEHPVFRSMNTERPKYGY